MTLRTRRPLLHLGPLAFILLLSTQCGEDNPAAPGPGLPPSDSVTETIDQAGGVVSLGDEAWVDVPAGALDGPLDITIARVPNAPNPPANHVSRVMGYSFTPHGYAFDAPVTMGVAFVADSAMSAPLMMRLDDDADTSWEFLVGAVITDSAATCSTSTFSILSIASFKALGEVYVSPDSQGPNASGTRDDPLPTITGGIQASLGAGTPYPPVLVAAGTYEGAIEFVGGVSIRGGLDGETWEHPADAESRSIVDLGTSAAMATGITDSTVIKGLALRAGASAGDPSPNSVALHLVDCREGLRFVNCRFLAGSAADGDSGTAGTDGADGGNGAHSGRIGETIFNGNWMTGGPGGTGASNHPGGKGGDAAYAGCGWQGNAGYPWGCGGGGGTGAWCPIGSFYGGYGPAGAHGANGSAGSNSGTPAIDGWRPTFAGSGEDGGAGCGGGGGGGGVLPITGGMGGAGGGGGGNGGGPGAGGRGGGSSFAVYMWESSPVFESCEFVAGEGGRGGKGGNGGSLGDGGAGGVSHGSTNIYVIGGNGGAGGDGGFGGSGGGGAGGNSFCVYRVGAVCENADFSTCPPWAFVSGTPGRGGEGGQAVHIGPGGTVDREGIQAPRGADGESGLIGP